MKKLILPFVMLLFLLISCKKEETFSFNEEIIMTVSCRDENYEIENDDKKEIISLLNDLDFQKDNELYAGYVYVLKYNDISILLTDIAYYSVDGTQYVAKSSKSYKKLYTLVSNIYNDLHV